MKLKGNFAKVQKNKYEWSKKEVKSESTNRVGDEANKVQKKNLGFTATVLISLSSIFLFILFKVEFLLILSYC